MSRLSCLTPPVSSRLLTFLISPSFLLASRNSDLSLGSRRTSFSNYEAERAGQREWAGQRGWVGPVTQQRSQSESKSVTLTLHKQIKERRSKTSKHLLMLMLMPGRRPGSNKSVIYGALLLKAPPPREATPISLNRHTK